ncbi:hypothetical protein SSX86_021268 [Deinandra increscens subsp. villosa]|uniref:non-specific serine/threonine protein kinase n=1 Tax=Deinandra increscens subsp. villosa TaxID=3103831 RepID=A0AAP0CWE2_9ASTR
MFVPNSHEVGSSSSELPQLCCRFTFSEIQLATQNLDESLVIGRGGFGKVYKGTIANGTDLLTVAIKRLDSTSNQGASEFWAEINMLSNLRHCHLVSLIGYCNDEEEMILIYEYMPHGSLKDHLHKSQTPLSWMQRLTICTGAARGLDYLHTGTGIKHGVIHRDVKSSNILLHESWAAKISDFGLSKICPKDLQATHVNTLVKGTFGYLDPDYFYTGKLTRKSDVYAFGVVLFEVLCGKRAVDRSIDEEQWALAIWAQDSIRKGRLKQIVDGNIREISPKCLKLFAHLAKRCLHKHPKQRPTMAEIVVGLETILALQEKANNTLQPTSLQVFAKTAPTVIIPSNDENLGGVRSQTLRRFDYDTINIATENFSEVNRIQKLKTYDSLYKGKLQNGQGIAVGRICLLVRNEYFMNEASTLVKLEHKNLAKLLGYCTKEGTHDMLFVYEFELHTSLDHLLFDPKCTLLTWEKRYDIILGVARALLYLHRDAPIQIIQCNVKPGNILLDENMNPILSGFLDTRYLDVRDTYLPDIFIPRHYVAPEYMCDADVSTKADVYSLGMLVLAIIGHRWSGGVPPIEYVQMEGRLSNIIDPRIDVDLSFMARFFEISLLCVKKDAPDRPTMEEVVSMLLDSSSFTPPDANIVAQSSSTDGIVHDYDNTACEEFLSDLYPR